MKQTITINPNSLNVDMHRTGRRIRTLMDEIQKPVTITISDKQETRRDKQNRLLWKWHGEFAAHIKEHQGEIYGTEDIHEYVAGKLLPKKVIAVFGEPEIKRTQTKDLSVKEFADFLTTYDMWANENYQCRFSHPEDLYLASMGVAA